MRKLGRKAWTVAGILIALCIMLFIYYSFYSYPYLLRRNIVVNGIYVSEDLLFVSEKNNINYCKLLKKAIKKDTASIKALTLLEFWDGISYDHGGVIVDLIEIIGEDKFLQSLATINNREKSDVDSYLSVGLAYNYDSKFHGKTLEEAFPKIYKFLDYDKNGVIDDDDTETATSDTLSPAVIFDTLTDTRDGQAYRTVKIGGKIWMAQNLNYKPRTGESWCYNNDTSYCDEYGRLYDWNTAKKVCPNGWKLPDSTDWITLLTTAGGKKIAGKKLKSKGGWSGNGNGTDNYGFSALPGGCRDIDGDFKMLLIADGKFSDAGDYGNWWTATERHDGNVYNRYISNRSDYLYEGNNVKDYGFSVRCVADNP